VVSVGAGSRLVQLRTSEPLGFTGGQFIIVDSGLTLPSGKAAKRAYSPITGDREQLSFELVVKLIPDGPASGFMHALQLGDEVRFSGPWGKMVPTFGCDSGTAPALRGGASFDGATLVLASDTGITAALGLVRGERFARLLPRATLIWLRGSSSDFLDDRFVQERVPAGCSLRIEALPPPSHPERVPHVRALVQRHWREHGIARAFCAGDGAINYALIDDLNAGGVAMTPHQVESFFNMPKKSA
jgi:ferredoxin-NADP reductase